MTGPEHYAEAERLLALAAEEYDVADPYHTSAVASAQVHATLALAAATVQFESGGWSPAWAEVFGGAS
ncbi:hypothetical protein [Tsukamurella tyrosinosolvens]|uniref:hypothetical protein n=1 Tax=Tsukamurella tyrosinosolvens TaxID=57704 RepID=UPI002DD44B29|nr:hypothetical protein [Tsukamurella tyrosinosolvens]MEC4615833.1 hypothetical protein [Tsukamurella tyrosinosolvens]